MSAPAIRPLIVGNWKMNGLTAALEQARAVGDSLAVNPANADTAICPPATLIAAMAQSLSGSSVAVGGQDCHPQVAGAHTGDIAAAMLADAGASLVIIGHSERRADHGETNALVAAKVEAALAANLRPIVCVGETLAQRQSGETLAVIETQVRESLPPSLADAGFAVAYEPVWAIGTGLTPTLAQIEEVHLAIRAQLADQLGQGGRIAPILYGGSVKPDNAAEILGAAEVGGALVGGASLKAADFLGIIRAV